jgi:hypothetical protein
MTELEKLEKFKNLYAIHRLCPRAKFTIIDGDLSTLEWYDNEIPRPTNVEIEAEADGIIAEYHTNEYQRKRAAEYPKIVDQLDMLYHDIKAGNLANGSWIEAIEEVKNTFPKP